MRVAHIHHHLLVKYVLSVNPNKKMANIRNAIPTLNYQELLDSTSRTFIKTPPTAQDALLFAPIETKPNNGQVKLLGKDGGKKERRKSVTTTTTTTSKNSQPGKNKNPRGEKLKFKNSQPGEKVKVKKSLDASGNFVDQGIFTFPQPKNSQRSVKQVDNNNNNSKRRTDRLRLEKLTYKQYCRIYWPIFLPNNKEERGQGMKRLQQPQQGGNSGTASAAAASSSARPLPQQNKKPVQQQQQQQSVEKEDEFADLKRAINKAADNDRLTATFNLLNPPRFVDEYNKAKSEKSLSDLCTKMIIPYLEMEYKPEKLSKEKALFTEKVNGFRFIQLKYELGPDEKLHRKFLDVDNNKATSYILSEGKIVECNDKALCEVTRTNFKLKSPDSTIVPVAAEIHMASKITCDIRIMCDVLPGTFLFSSIKKDVTSAHTHRKSFQDLHTVCQKEKTESRYSQFVTLLNDLDCSKKLPALKFDKDKYYIIGAAGKNKDDTESINKMKKFISDRNISIMDGKLGAFRFWCFDKSNLSVLSRYYDENDNNKVDGSIRKPSDLSICVQFPDRKPTPQILHDLSIVVTYYYPTERTKSIIAKGGSHDATNLGFDYDSPSEEDEDDSSYDSSEGSDDDDNNDNDSNERHRDRNASNENDGRQSNNDSSESEEDSESSEEDNFIDLLSK